MVQSPSSLTTWRGISRKHKFQDMIPRKSEVIRSTGTQIVEATEVVKGDLVELNEGDQVPADVRVISANELHVDNASLTGEAEPQQRTGEIEKVVDVPVVQIQEVERIEEVLVRYCIPASPVCKLCPES